MVKKVHELFDDEHTSLQRNVVTGKQIKSLQMCSIQGAWFRRPRHTDNGIRNQCRQALELCAS